MSPSFPTLGVVVEAGKVYKAGFGNRAYLGPLAGAQAELGEPTRHRRVGAAVSTTIVTGGVFGVLGLAPMLSKKSKALAFVVFPNGTVHERPLDGNMAIRSAQSEVARFNAMARAAEPMPSSPVRELYSSHRDLRSLGLSEFSFDEQFLISRAAAAFDQDEGIIAISCGLLAGRRGTATISPCRAALAIGDNKLVIFCDRTVNYWRYEAEYAELTDVESVQRGVLTLAAGDIRLELSDLPGDSASRLVTGISEIRATGSAPSLDATADDRGQMPGVAGFSAADEIRKFADLHAAGILSDDEFAIKKKQLLDLPGPPDVPQ